MRLITTHVSWVFVTDHDVWKLKRPVDYGFVDYTTLERRQHFCHEELRVNRRLAPDVYLRRRACPRARRRHGFTSIGTIVDYAVRMRRLDESYSADSLVTSGQLTHDHLAVSQGGSRRSTRPTAPASDPEVLDVVRANVDENFVQVRPFVGRFVDAVDIRDGP